jgi:two-component system response regulator HydG
MDRTAILIVPLSESFEDLWAPLADELNVDLTIADPGQAQVVTRGCAALILAAGAAEREALEWIEQHALEPPIPVVVVGADPSRRIAVRLVRRGARDYVTLPEDLEILRNTLSSLVARRRNADAARPKELDDERREAFRAIVGESPSIRGLLVRAAKILPHDDTTAMIIGETGTGKELLARAIHDGGPRSGAPFVDVNCSALPSHLVESELFGHERGAFTDAHAAKPGLFEMAAGGTLFLDELGTFPIELQAKLLRALEEKEVRRVGGTKSRKIDVRIIAATNANLQDAVRAGTFREDLFFRVSVITFSLPPLRERDGDVLIIAQHLLDHMAEQHGLPSPRLSPEAKSALSGYHWPGNVRELKNALERALLLSDEGELDIDELIPGQTQRQPRGGPIPFPAQLDDIATAAARATLTMCDGNRSEAARQLGISRKRLRRLLGEEPAAGA